MNGAPTHTSTHTQSKKNIEKKRRSIGKVRYGRQNPAKSTLTGCPRH